MEIIKFPVAATVRIVAKIKNKALTETENFNCQVSAVKLPYPKHTLIDMVQVDVADKFTEIFLERLKNNHALRNQIGGIKWRVDVSSVQFSDEGLV